MASPTERALRAMLLVILDHVDYRSDPPACRLNEMVGAVLPADVLRQAQELVALSREMDARSGEQSGGDAGNS